MALLFNGTNGAHEYFLDGIETPSVTRILRDLGLIHFNGVPPHILDTARKRGAAVHRLCHYANDGDLDEASVDDAYRGYLGAWRRCVAERTIVPLFCEHRLASRRHRVTGTLDLLCEIAGDGWILDYATGDPVQCAKQLQTAGYLGLALEWQTEDPTLAAVLARHPRWRRAAVRLHRTGSFKFVEYTDARDYARFLTLAGAWHIRQDFGVVTHAEDLAAA